MEEITFILVRRRLKYIECRETIDCGYERDIAGPVETGLGP